MAFEQPYPLLLSLLFAFLPLPTFAQTYSNFSLGSFLLAREDHNSFWASPSGDFEFGFQQVEEDGFLLSIWFNKIPERTVVWSANGENLAPRGSKVELTSDGWFWLNDPSGKQIWNASSSGNGVAYAAMLDTGNFVLADQDSQTLWESFDLPTDTILPGQVLNQPSRLVSRYSENNYSRGRFQFVLQNDGNLVLYTTQFPLDYTSLAYWLTLVLGSGFSLVFNQSAYIFAQRGDGSIIETISSNPPSTQDFYHRTILDYDGDFRHYYYPKRSNSNTSSPMAWLTWSFIPSNICLSIGAETGVGSGACGFNSYCMYNGTKICHCPTGYSFIDPNDTMKGCKQDFVSQSCDDTPSETHLFDFHEMSNTDWPYTDYEYFTSTNEDWCKQACLDDCFCAITYFLDGNCWKKKLPFSFGRMDSSIKGKTPIKIRKDNSTLNSRDTNRNNDRSKLNIIGSILLSSSVCLNLVLLVAACLVANWFVHKILKVRQVFSFSPSMNLRSFTYEELRKATNEFTKELGRGACATVYKGVLLDLPGSLVAVKKLNMVKESEEEFEAEVIAIGRTHHRNLVQLLGFCNEREHRLLVYEFMSNGSLASFLFEEKRPSWYQRVQIAIGTARGLLYLHEECSTQIIHCDIKPQNVLLDDTYTAKISDLGLAKLLKSDQTVTTTAIRGTKGYVAAEWFKNMPINIKVDVYSYGVLLLELICCKRNFDIKAEDENEMVLVDWACDCFQDGKLYLLVEDDKEALDDIKRVEKYVMIAIWCIQEDPSLRPTMEQVLQILQGYMDVPNPPDPPSFTSSLYTCMCSGDCLDLFAVHVHSAIVVFFDRYSKSKLCTN